MTLFTHSAVRLVAIAAALAWVLTPIASTLHADSHAHVYCAQHQRIEESSAGSGGAAIPAGLDEADDSGSQALHTACAFPVFSARSAFSLSPPFTDAISAQRQLVSSAALSCPLRSRDVLAHAPKASPPLA